MLLKTTSNIRQELYINALINRADIYHLIGSEAMAMEDYEAVLSITRDVDNQVNTLIMLSDISIKQGNVTDSLAFTEKIAAIVQGSKDPFLKGKAILAKAHVMRYRGEFRDAMKLMKSALAYYQRAEQNPRKSMKEFRAIGKSIARCNHNLGIVYYGLGDYDLALEYFSKSVKVMSGLSNKIGELQSLNNIGLVLWRKGKLKEAEKAFHKALEMSVKMGHKSGIAFITGNLGLVLNDRGMYSDGLDYLQQAVRSAKEIGDRSLTGTHLNNMGNSYEALLDYRTAMECYTQSLKIFQEIGFLHGTAMLLNNVGTVYCVWAQLSKALSYATEAEKVAESENLTEVMVRCYSNKGKILAYMKKHRVGEQALMKAYRLAEKQEMTGLLIEIMVEYIHAACIGFLDNKIDIYHLCADFIKNLENQLVETELSFMKKCFIRLIIMRYRLLVSTGVSVQLFRKGLKKMSGKIDNERILIEYAIACALMNLRCDLDYGIHLKHAEELSHKIGSKILIKEIIDMRSFAQRR